MEAVARRRAAVALAGLIVVTGGAFVASVTATSAQSVPSTTTTDASVTTTIVATTAPETTVPPVDTTVPSTVESDAIGPLCHVFTPQPAVGDPVVTQVILTSTGEVVATRTGDGPYVPADFDRRCNPPTPAAPATAVSGRSTYTG